MTSDWHDIMRIDKRYMTKYILVVSSVHVSIVLFQLMRWVSFYVVKHVGESFLLSGTSLDRLFLTSSYTLTFTLRNQDILPVDMRICVPETGIKGRDKYSHRTDIVGCTYLSMTLIPASGTQVLI